MVKRAFGQNDEAALIDALRKDGDVALELVAEDRRKIVGHVLLSRFREPEGWLALAPVSVDPKRQKKGIGSALCQIALDYANAPVVVLGDPDFYGRFGFDPARAGNLTSPYPLDYTGLFAPEIEEKAPRQTLVYAPAFGG